MLCKAGDKTLKIRKGNAMGHCCPAVLLSDCRSASSETAENYLLDLDTADSKLISVGAREFGIHYDVDHCMGTLAPV